MMVVIPKVYDLFIFTGHSNVFFLVTSDPQLIQAKVEEVDKEITGR